MINIVIVIVGLVLGGLLTIIGIFHAIKQTRQYKEEADRLEKEFNKP